VINYVGFNGYVGVLCRSEKKRKKIRSKERERGCTKERGNGIILKIDIIIFKRYLIQFIPVNVCTEGHSTYPLGMSLRCGSGEHAYYEQTTLPPNLESICMVYSSSTVLYQPAKSTTLHPTCLSEAFEERVQFQLAIHLHSPPLTQHSNNVI